MAGPTRQRIKNSLVHQGMNLVEKTQALIIEANLTKPQALVLYEILIGNYSHAMKAHSDEVQEDCHDYLRYLNDEKKKYE
ncbi:hypothetical protein J4216_00380 [Candidatus Woesearchaeota archaeon]|nr:hypothetical protein [Candidatus Woesearchaeota archaeon]